MSNRITFFNPSNTRPWTVFCEMFLTRARKSSYEKHRRGRPHFILLFYRFQQNYAIIVPYY
ncbi:hypothetical protein HMPREF9996_00685 [Aggregatibacter actinomycetemcomitans Y4]|nr:hypothetical protein HMPREF9996_00685 [Aggregatibacter actinomycetemcomitans Y4]